MGNSRVKVVEFRPYDVISSLLKQKVEIILLKVLVNLHFLFVPVSNIYLPDRRPYYIIGTALSHFSKLSCAEQRNGRPNSVILCVCVCVCVWVGGWVGGAIFSVQFFSWSNFGKKFFFLLFSYIFFIPFRRAVLFSPCSIHPPPALTFSKCYDPLSFTFFQK